MRKVHRPKHQQKTRFNWSWIIIGLCCLVIIYICGYFAIKLNQEHNTAATQISSIHKKVIVVNDTPKDNDNTISSSSLAASSSSVSQIRQLPDLKTASVCACLLVAPNWFKTNQITFNQNGQTGYMKDTNGNTAEIQENGNNNLTITLLPHGVKGEVRQVSADELYNDYYNTPLKQSQVNSFASHVN